jgi:hypothetical protein
MPKKTKEQFIPKFVLLSNKSYREKPLRDVITSRGGAFPERENYENYSSFVCINFRKIRKQIDEKLKPEEPYSTFDVKNAIDVKYPRLREWLDRKQFVPSLQEADGVAVKALFSHQDIYFLGLFKALIDNGYPRNRACNTIKYLREKIFAKKDERIEEFDHVIFILPE